MVNMSVSEKCMDRQGEAPQEGQRIACRNNGNFSLDQIFDKHVMSQGDKFLRQLLIFSHFYQTGSQQIYRNDWSNSSKNRAGWVTSWQKIATHNIQPRRSCEEMSLTLNYCFWQSLHFQMLQEQDWTVTGIWYVLFSQTRTKWPWQYFLETRCLRSYHLKYLLLHGSPFRCGLPTHVSKIAHYHFGAFCFTSTTFSTNKNRLTYSFIQHQSATIE